MYLEERWPYGWVEVGAKRGLSRVAILDAAHAGVCRLARVVVGAEEEANGGGVEAVGAVGGAAAACALAATLGSSAFVMSVHTENPPHAVDVCTPRRCRCC